MTQDTRPAPLVPLEADLRGYEFMPFYGAWLRASDFNATCTDAEYRAAVNLWWSSWHQTPPASLPNDDRVLCKLADLGRSQKKWKRVKTAAMEGFTLCSDGRFYHEFLSVQARIQWDLRKAAIARGVKSGAARRMKASIGGLSTSGEDETFSKQSRNDFETESNKGEGKGRLSNNRFPSDESISAPEPPKAVERQPQVNPSSEARILAECTRAQLENPTAENSIVARWIRNGATPTQVVNALIEARKAIHPPAELTAAYVDPIVERITTQDRRALATAAARVQRTQDQIADQRKAAEAAAPMPPNVFEALPATLKRAVGKGE